MLRLVADENFNDKIVRGLVRQQPTLDIIHIQDVDPFAEPKQRRWKKMHHNPERWIHPIQATLLNCLASVDCTMFIDSIQSENLDRMSF